MEIVRNGVFVGSHDPLFEDVYRPCNLGYKLFYTQYFLLD